MKDDDDDNRPAFPASFSLETVIQGVAPWLHFAKIKFFLKITEL